MYSLLKLFLDFFKQFGTVCSDDVMLGPSLNGGFFYVHVSLRVSEVHFAS